MLGFSRVARPFVILLLVLIVTGCKSPNDGAIGRTTESSAGFVSDFPYNPLVYHMDLSILAYQLYAQSLVWP
jgi:hypothetical protein